MPGSALGLASLASHLGPLVIRTFDLGKGTAARDRELAAGSPALAVLFTDRDGTRDWVMAGQALAVFSLRLAADGISVSYLNQPLELPLLRSRLRDVLSYGGTPQLLLRLGYGKGVRATSRRPLEEVIRE